jgi:hypothetical protein
MCIPPTPTACSPDANVLAAGDVYGSRTYPNLDWGGGGTIDGMILAHETFLEAANDTRSGRDQVLNGELAAFL